MTNVEMTSEITVKLIRAMAHDDFVVQAAQVSNIGENTPGTEPKRLINSLMKHRHGSPFEHTSFTFFVEAPIFVFREWHRHRIASINEMSGRYTTLLPKFYTPHTSRKLVNVGTSMSPKMDWGSYEQTKFMSDTDRHVAKNTWKVYEERLSAGISNELARTILPLNVYSQMYWTVNARSLMNFLSLRVDSLDSAVETHPQWEIQMGAEKMEEAFKMFMPHTHAAFVANGRVAP